MSKPDGTRGRRVAKETLLTPTQAAEFLSVTVRALDAWRYRGGGPVYVKVSSRCVRYRRADLEQWIAQRLRTSTSDPGHLAEHDHG